MAGDATQVAFVSQRRWHAELGRRISAGHEAAPGLYAGIQPWWSRQHWLDQVVRPELARAGRQTFYGRALPETVFMVARGLAGHADHRTGRYCRPTNDRLAAELGMAVRTVQRCRAILKELGLVVQVVAGCTNMTLDQRLVAHGRGSSHRAIAAEFALTVPAGWLGDARDASRSTSGATALRRPQMARRPVEQVTPPVGASVGRESPVNPGFLTIERPKEERLRRTHNRRPPGASLARDVRARRLIAEAQRELPWLRPVPPRRLTALVRFAHQGWTGRDIRLAVADRLRMLGVTVPRELDQPAAYVAWVLREIDPADRPTAYEEQQRAEEHQRRRWDAWKLSGAAPECPHGEPAGDQLHPITRVRACPFCRREMDATRRAGLE